MGKSVRIPAGTDEIIPVATSATPPPHKGIDWEAIKRRFGTEVRKQQPQNVRAWEEESDAHV